MKKLMIISAIFVITFSGCDEKGGEQKAQNTPKQEVAQPKVEAPKPIQKKVEKSGKDLFVKCTSCHGAFGQKSALNVSKIIKGWDKAKVLNALKGYKDGSYGGVRKALMKTQISPYTETELEKVAEYISTL